MYSLLAVVAAFYEQVPAPLFRIQSEGRCTRANDTMRGLGREGSRHGLEEFTELKYVCIAIPEAA